MAAGETCVVKGGGKGLGRAGDLEQKFKAINNRVCKNKGNYKVQRKLFIPFQPQECENKNCKVNGPEDWDNLQGKGEIVCHRGTNFSS